MQVKRGKFHKYLGMTLEYNTVFQVNITMSDQINETIDTFDKADPTDIGTKSSPALDILFKVEEYY